MADLLIRDAELGGWNSDVRLREGIVVEIGALAAGAGETILEARGGALLPGLHDHHIHVAATAAARASVACGPPEVRDEAMLQMALARTGEGWLRGIGYHESVAGILDRGWLDDAVPHRPVRIQHRSGRMWFLNSRALDLVLASGIPAPASLDRATGRLFDSDTWLRAALGGTWPAFAPVGTELARYGITGLTEMSPTNDDAVAAHFASERARGGLPQRVTIAGTPALGARGLDPALTLGPLKLHLHEAHLPDFAVTVTTIRAARERERAVAIHCVSEVELVYALAMLGEVGPARGDRIEHASVVPHHLIAGIVATGAAVVAQPHFVAERGDAYLADIEPGIWPDLYRLRSLAEAGIPLAGGSDAPFGQTDPWAAMAAAVSRRTADGKVLGETESLTPEAALALFLADPTDLTRIRTIAVGAPADLCLLDRPWADARGELTAGLVRATIIDGQIVYQRVDQTPAQRCSGRNTPAREHQERGALAANPPRQRDGAAETGNDPHREFGKLEPRARGGDQAIRERRELEPRTDASAVHVDGKTAVAPKQRPRG